MSQFLLNNQSKSGLNSEKVYLVFKDILKLFNNTHVFDPNI